MEEYTHKKTPPRSRFVTSVGTAIVSLVFLFSSATAFAASLYFSPSTGSYRVGQSFSVGVYVSSPDSAMNAASGMVTFPSDKLEVTSVSKSGSIFSLWVAEPSFSNASGTAQFEGIVLNPGFSGSAGKLMTLTFRAKSPGTADVRLSTSSASVLANDGKGTNILTGLGTASFAVVIDEKAPAEPEEPSGGGVPSAPKVSSSTHPEPKSFYKNNNPVFSWSLPGGITGVNVLADHNPTTDPGTKSDGTFSTYTYDNVDDGKWFFHIRLKNADGWGSATHFGFNIDTQPPDRFEITDDRKDKSDPRVALKFDATDATSGVDRYAIRVDDALPVEWKDDGKHVYQTETLSSGNHTFVVAAIDAAGNQLEKSLQLNVTGIDPPTITDYKEELSVGDRLEVSGTTYSNASVTVSFEHEGQAAKTTIVDADANGRFTARMKDRVKEGDYRVWAQARDIRGAVSGNSKPVSITVLARTNNFMIMLLIFIIIILALLALNAHLWRLFVTGHFEKRKREKSAMNRSMQKAFVAFRADVRRQIHALEKRRAQYASMVEHDDKAIEELKHSLIRAEQRIACDKKPDADEKGK